MVRIPYIEQRIRQVIEGFGPLYFTKPEVVNEICRDQPVVDILARLSRLPRRWSMGEMLVEYIEGRVSYFLGHEAVVAFVTVNGPFRVRAYENYAVGEGPRRWQRLEGMTADELRVCITARRSQVAGHERVIRVYEAMLAILERIGPTATMANMTPSDMEVVAAAANAT